MLIGGTAVSLGAQTMWDAYNFSQNNYYGTARSVALGNAMTAVGGDLGSIEFNPAGAAVTTYSQFVLTPSITVSTSSTMGQCMAGSNSPYCFQNQEVDNSTRFKMPNFGLMLNVDTGRSRGIRNWTFGFLGHATQNYQNSILATGINDDTTLAGAMAWEAMGMPQANLGAGWWDDVDPLPSWRTMTAYKAGIIDTYNGLDSDYLGITESLLDDGGIQLTDRINQEYAARRSGNKYDLVTNFAFNVSDRFFFGANMGVMCLGYSSEEYWIEQAGDPSKFLIEYEGDDGISTKTANFNYLRMRYSYEASGGGIYAKAGFLWRVFDGLRLAAAIQTPTLYGITERYASDAKTVFMQSDFNKSAESPQGEWSYDLVSPWSYNVGIAYTLGAMALVSVDYADIANNYGRRHNLRAGVEVRVLPELAVRGGYTYSTHPQLNYINGDHSSYSVGLGYSSNGSFFADLAVRVQTLPEEHLNIYSDYAYNADGDLVFPSPTVNINTNLIDALVTVGWRF